jgi:hypothetical protein
VNLGLAAPVWLSALAVLLPLIWLYLRTRRRPPAYVSSLVLWRAVAEPVVQKRRPRLPLLFFVQALLIVAAALALAQPFTRRPLPPGPAKDAIVVIDVSASMQARAQGEGSTRFALARDAARERADDLARAGRRLTVIAAGQQPQVLGTDLDGARATALIAALEPRDTGGNLTAAAELAVAQAGAQGSIDVFTDAASDGLVLSRDARAKATVHRFGSGGSNVGLAGVRVVASPFDAPGRTRVVVTVRNYSAETRTVEVRVAPLGAQRDAKESTARSLTLGPGATDVVSIDGLTWTGPFQAKLSPEDDLALDDTIYGVLPVPAPLDVLLVSEDDALQRALENLARSLGNVTVRTILPIQFHPENATGITILDRVTPQQPPAGNVAYLAPPRGNNDVTVAGGSLHARFAEQREHPLTYGLTNAHTLLGGVDVVALAPSATMKPVLLGRADGREVPLVLAGEVGGRRVVATAFAPRAADLRSADALPALVFTIDLLRWLAPSAGDAPLTRIAGERLRAGFPDATPIGHVDGPGLARDLGPSDEITLEKAGVYTTTSSSGTRQLLVSFIDPTESDIARPAITEPAPPPVPTAEPATAAPRVWQELPYVREVLLVALAAMLLEWLVVAASGPRLRRPATGAPAQVDAGGTR